MCAISVCADKNNILFIFGTSLHAYKATAVEFLSKQSLKKKKNDVWFAICGKVVFLQLLKLVAQLYAGEAYGTV